MRWGRGTERSPTLPGPLRLRTLPSRLDTQHPALACARARKRACRVGYRLSPCSGAYRRTLHVPNLMPPTVQSPLSSFAYGL